MKYLLLVITVLIPFFLAAQTVRVKGIVADAEGERLPQAHITVYPDTLQIISGNNGAFSFLLPAGKVRVQISYAGFETFTAAWNIKNDTAVSVTMHMRTDQLQEVEVVSERSYQEEIFNSTRSGSHVLTQKDFTGIPVLGGEADIIKALQLLPGTVRGVEGSSDLFVRGGAADQNLVLLDNAPIYNTSHLFGFLSVFNPDMLEKVEAINGGFPSRYGGRLSSILDVQTNSDIASQTHVSADVGLIASRLYIEQPLVKDKVSLWIAGRRTYIDQVVKAIGEELPYFFYDLNGKLILKPSVRDEVQISYYSGEDILNLFRDRNGDGDGFTTAYESGNSSQSIQWTRKISPEWTSMISGIRSNYKYTISNSFEENSLLAFSDIEDVGLRFLVRNDSVKNLHAVKIGGEWTRHDISPNVVNTSGTIAQLLESSSASGRVANEFAVFAEQEMPLSTRWRINTGMRLSMAIVGTKKYFNPEPRVSARYEINDGSSLKLSYSRMVQYLHRVSSSAVSSPTDIWYPVTDSIRPQTANQFSAAYQRFLPERNVMLSVEGYYKNMNQLIGYEEGTNLFFNTDFESRLIQGKGRAYGMEVLLRKPSGKLTGWVSYTLSWSTRQFDLMNNGEWFRARYDRRHNVAVVMQYALHKRVSLSMVWEFISGSRFTPIIGQYAILAPAPTGVDLIPVYAPLNSVKLSDTHRLDLGVKWMSKPGKKFQWHWFAGVYNTYNRANPVAITIEQDETTGALAYEQPGLFGLLPFISYGFKF